MNKLPYNMADLTISLREVFERSTDAPDLSIFLMNMFDDEEIVTDILESTEFTTYINKLAEFSYNQGYQTGLLGKT